MDEKEKINEKLDSEQMDEDDSSVWKYVPYLLLLLILVFFCVFGITYSIYKGDAGEDSEIITDQIIFSYSDVDKVGNGINIKNATPTQDNMGKIMLGKNQYFDFSITATTGNSKVNYQLLVNKNSASTLSDDSIRIYLTKMLGGYEEGLVLVDFSDLKTKVINNIEYYVLYEKQLSENLDNYSDVYRLRMWVAEDATNYEDKMFSIKIDVHAVQAEVE